MTKEIKHLSGQDVGYLIPTTATIMVLNGPPRCGKDTIANEVANQLSGVVQILPLAMSMRLAGFAMLGESYSFERYEELKVTKIKEFGGLNFREWMIRFSERFMKKIGGQDVFARLWLKQVENYYLTRPGAVDIPMTWLVPDGGFTTEQFVIATECGLAKYVLGRVTREGTSFAGDSREYVFLPRAIPQFDLHNNGTIGEAVQTVVNHLA